MTVTFNDKQKTIDMQRSLIHIFILSCLIFFHKTEIFGTDEKLYCLLGVVQDAETGNPLPFTNIRILGTTRGTTSNIEGKYQLMLQPGRYRIVFSYMGYRSDTLRIEIQEAAVRHDVFLKPTVIPMQSVTVFSDEYNPAAKIILETINKKKRVLSELHSTQFEAYTKSVFSMERKKKTKQDTFIGGICEVKSNNYWRKPDKYKEVIIARCQTKNLLPAMNLFTVGKIPNLNDDTITLERNLIIGPTAPNAFDYYCYEMVDTTAIDDIMVFRIKIIPGSQAAPLFEGIISIADSSFSVMEVDVRGNKALDLAPIHNVHIQEKFALYEGKFWLPIKVSLNCEIRYFSSQPPLFVEQISILDNYKINQPHPDHIFDKYQITALPTADAIDSTTWALQQRLPLTDKETRAYQHLDSSMTNANFFEKCLVFLVRSPFSLPRLPLTSFSDFFHFNRVEGVFLGLGFDSKNILPLNRITLKGGYGFSDKVWKHGATAEQFFSSNKKYSIGLKIRKSINFREPEPIYSLNAVTALCLFDKEDYYDYYLSKGWSIFNRWKPSPRWNISLQYLNENHHSIERRTNFSLLDRSKKYRINPPIQEGNLRSVQANITLDTREFIDLGVFEVPITTQKSWLINAQMEYSDNDYLKSNFDFIRYYLHIRRHQPTFATGFLDMDILLGGSNRSLPIQKFFDLTSRIEDFSTFGVFRTLRVKEFAGDKMAALFIEYNFGSYLFRASKIPIIKNGKIDLILNAGAGWTECSEQNKNQLQNIVATEDVFYEIGFGLGRIISFLRFDFSWRLTHRGKRNFVFTIGSSKY